MDNYLFFLPQIGHVENDGIGVYVITKNNVVILNKISYQREGNGQA